MTPTALDSHSLGREIVRLAIPAALQNLLQTVVFLVDTKMISHYALGLTSNGEPVTYPLAVLTLCGPITWSLTVIFAVASVGATAVVGRRVGEGQPAQARQTLLTAGLLAAASGLVVAALGVIFREDLVNGFLSFRPEERGDATELKEAAGRYLFWFLLLFPIRALVFTIAAGIRGAGDTRTPLWGAIVANVTNFVVNALFIFGLWGAPRLGVEGAGLGTALASVGELLFLAYWLFRGRAGGLRWNRADFERWGTGWRELIHVSIPAMFDAVLFHTGFLIYQLAIFELPESDMAAHRVAITLQSLAFMPAAGFYAAAGSVSARTIGARRPDLARRSAWLCVKIGLLAMIPVVIIFFAFAGPLAAFFSSEEESVYLTAAVCLRIGAFEVPFLMLTESLRGTLRGAGETRWPVLVTVVGTWCIRVPLSWILAIGVGWGLRGIWYTTVIDWILRSILTIWVVRKTSWEQRRL